MTLDDTRRCPGGKSRINPIRVREECVNCTRRRPWGDEPGPDDIDPMGCWVDATAHRAGYCTERRSQGFVITDEQAAGMDDMAGIHACTVPKDGGAAVSREQQMGARTAPIGGGSEVTRGVE